MAEAPHAAPGVDDDWFSEEHVAPYADSAGMSARELAVLCEGHGQQSWTRDHHGDMSAWLVGDSFRTAMSLEHIDGARDVRQGLASLRFRP